MLRRIKKKVYAVTIKPRMYLSLILLRFLPPYLSLVKGKNKLGEIRWYVLVHKEKDLVCVEWNKYAEIVREVYLKDVEK